MLLHCAIRWSGWDDFALCALHAYHTPMKTMTSYEHQTQQNTIHLKSQIVVSLKTHSWPNHRTKKQKAKGSQRYKMQIQVSSGNAEFLIPILNPICLSMVQGPGVCSSTKPLHWCALHAK